MSANIKNINHLPAGTPRHFEEKDLFFIPRRETVGFPRYIKNLPDVDTGIKHTIKKMVPPDKPFTKDSRILTLGSCFANNLAFELDKRKVKTCALTLPSNLQNIFSVNQFFRWVIEDESPTNYWHEPDGSRFGARDGERQAFLEDIKQCDGFIITLGVSEIWKDKHTDQILWRGVPRSSQKEDPERFTFEMATVADTRKSLCDIQRLIRSVVPEATIVFTLSPVPLSATFRGISAVVANCASKSILRAALCEYFIANDDDRVRYWPSYEIVTALPPHIAGMSSFGEDDQSQRHVNNSLVAKIISSFYESYFA